MCKTWEGELLAKAPANCHKLSRSTACAHEKVILVVLPRALLLSLLVGYKVYHTHLSPKPWRKNKVFIPVPDMIWLFSYTDWGLVIVAFTIIHSINPLRSNPYYRQDGHLLIATLVNQTRFNLNTGVTSRSHMLSRYSIIAQFFNVFYCCFKIAFSAGSWRNYLPRPVWSVKQTRALNAMLWPAELCVSVTVSPRPLFGEASMVWQAPHAQWMHGISG